MCMLVLLSLLNFNIMIAYLQGELTHKTPTHIYVDIGGVAYHVNISLHTFAAIEHESKAKIYTYQHITENDQSLYGFYTEEEKNLFIHLISVNGVGPNTARTITSYMTPADVKKAIVHDNVAVINKVKGIGPKTAKRIILDLKDKLIKEGMEVTESGGSTLSSITSNGVREEAISALVSLGFQKAKILKAVDAALAEKGPDCQVEELIKQVLRQLS